MSTEIDERGRVILLHLNVRNRSDVAISFTQSNRRRFHIFDADTCNEVYRDPSYTTFQAIGPRRIEVESYGEHVDTFIWYRETTEGNLVLAGEYLLQASYPTGRPGARRPTAVVPPPHRFRLPPPSTEGYTHDAVIE